MAAEPLFTGSGKSPDGLLGVLQLTMECEAAIRQSRCKFFDRKFRAIGMPDGQHLARSAPTAQFDGLGILSGRTAERGIEGREKRAQGEHLIHALKPDRHRELFFAQPFDHLLGQGPVLLIRHGFLVQQDDA
jgi:hypothetical protein